MIEKFNYVSPLPLMKYKKLLPSAQGMAIYGDMAFILYHTGMCGIYDLKNRNPDAAARFWLASANGGDPAGEYANHANQCMFSELFSEGGELPLLYVTAGNGAAGDEKGYYYRCAVEDIHIEKSGDHILGASSRLVQTISYLDRDVDLSCFEPPCWGCPAWFVDSENKAIYIFSSRYRTTKKFLPYYGQNRYIITRFDMPEPFSANFVILTGADIKEQFTVPFDILFTQGGTLRNGKIYYTFGMGSSTYPLGLRIIDLREKQVCNAEDLSTSCFSNEEIECCAFYGNHLLCNTNSTDIAVGGIYSLGFVSKKGDDWREIL